MKTGSWIVTIIILCAACVIIGRVTKKPETVFINVVNNDSLLSVQDSISRGNQLLTDENTGLKLKVGMLSYRIKQLHDEIYFLSKSDFRIYQDSVYTNRHNL